MWKSRVRLNGSSICLSDLLQFRMMAPVDVRQVTEVSELCTLVELASGSRLQGAPVEVLALQAQSFLRVRVRGEGGGGE